MFAKGKKIGRSIDWLAIAVADAYDGRKGTWQDRHAWVDDHREFIKSVVNSPDLIWRQDIDDKGEPNAKDPFQFAAACAEYIAADTHGPEYVTHLPVWLDASSNGLWKASQLGSLNPTALAGLLLRLRGHATALLLRTRAQTA